MYRSTRGVSRTRRVQKAQTVWVRRLNVAPFKPGLWPKARPSANFNPPGAAAWGSDTELAAARPHHAAEELRSLNLFVSTRNSQLISWSSIKL